MSDNKDKKDAATLSKEQNGGADGKGKDAAKGKDQPKEEELVCLIKYFKCLIL